MCCRCTESLGDHPGSLQGGRGGALGRGRGSEGAAGETGQAASSERAQEERGEGGARSWEKWCGKGKGPGPRPAAAPRGAGGKRGPGRRPALGQRPAVPAGIALIMWNALYTAEKAIIRWSLLAEACYFAVQFLGECPRAGRGEEEEGAKTLCGGKRGGWWAGRWWSIFPASCLPFFLSHGIASVLSCSLNSNV